MSIAPGLWVMQSGGRACSTATCSVTPHAQNTGSSSSRIPGRVTGERLLEIADADQLRKADVYGAPWTLGRRDVIESPESRLLD